MNVTSSGFRLLAIGAALALCGQSAHASLFFGPTPSAIYQPGISAQVRLGLTVQARTNLSRLVAGGSFDAWCMSEYTDHIKRERELTSALIARPNVLFVTIPETIPAYLNMPGFENLERGRTIDCYFDWKAYAEESSITVGVFGTTITVEGEKAKTSGSEYFDMRKPGTATGDDDACIP